MSWGTCYSGSNNIHFGFPPIMTDGRNYATWQPQAVVNNEIRQRENIKTNWEYRQYLTNNAQEIMKINSIEACDQCCYCPPKYGNYQPNNGTPFLYTSCTDSTQPFGYENSDLKNQYLSSSQLQARTYAPIVTQDKYLQYEMPNYN